MHSRASFCAAEMSPGVILFATRDHFNNWNRSIARCNRVPRDWKSIPVESGNTSVDGNLANHRNTYSNQGFILVILPNRTGIVYVTYWFIAKNKRIKGSSYSTTLVVLLHTLTGKFLCGRDVGRGHPFRNDVSVFGCVLIPRWCGDVQPYMGIDIILYDPLSSSLSIS